MNFINRDVDMTSPLSLREDSKKGNNPFNKHSNQSEVYVQGLSEFSVKNVKETLDLLKTAENNRKVRETALNLFSSRSHSIFQVKEVNNDTSSNDDVMIMIVIIIIMMMMMIAMISIEIIILVIMI